MVRTKRCLTAADGSTVYRGEEGGPDVTVTPVEGGVRISTVLWDESDPASFGYPLPEGVDAEVQPTESRCPRRTSSRTGS